MENQTNDLDALIASRVDEAVERKLREAELAKYPQPEPARSVSQWWPKPGLYFEAALEAATDSFERDGNVAEAAESIYSQSRRDPLLASDLHAWRHDENGIRRDWSHKAFEAGLIQNLIRNRHQVREAYRGHIVSAVPDSVLAELREHAK